MNFKTAKSSMKSGKNLLHSASVGFPTLSCFFSSWFWHKKEISYFFIFCFFSPNFKWVEGKQKKAKLRKRKKDLPTHVKDRYAFKRLLLEIMFCFCLIAILVRVATKRTLVHCLLVSQAKALQFSRSRNLGSNHNDPVKTHLIFIGINSMAWIPRYTYVRMKPGGKSLDSGRITNLSLDLVWLKIKRKCMVHCHQSFL